jgi:hypothetical protein
VPPQTKGTPIWRRAKATTCATVFRRAAGLVAVLCLAPFARANAP